MKRADTTICYLFSSLSVDERYEVWEALSVYDACSFVMCCRRLHAEGASIVSYKKRKALLELLSRHMAMPMEGDYKWKALRGRVFTELQPSWRCKGRCKAVAHTYNVHISGTMVLAPQGDQTYWTPRLSDVEASTVRSWLPFGDAWAAMPLFEGLTYVDHTFTDYTGAVGLPIAGQPGEYRWFRQVIKLHARFRSEHGLVIAAEGMICTIPELGFEQVVEDGTSAFQNIKTHIHWECVSVFLPSPAFVIV